MKRKYNWGGVKYKIYREFDASQFCRERNQLTNILNIYRKITLKNADPVGDVLLDEALKHIKVGIYLSLGVIS